MPKADCSEARRRAWATRRAKFGPKGYGSDAYGRGGTSSGDPRDFDILRMRTLIAKLTNEGVLSEGQAVEAVGMHRIDFRDLRIRLNPELQGYDPEAGKAS